MTAPHHMRADLCDSHLSTVLGLCRGLATTPSELLDDLPLPIQARSRQGLLRRLFSNVARCRVSRPRAILPRGTTRGAQQGTQGV